MTWKMRVGERTIMLMLTWLKKLTVMFMAAGLIAGLLPVPVARATLSSCTADSTPHQVAPNSTTDIAFSLQNTDVSPIRWMRLIVPTLDYTITNVTISGWTFNSPGGTTT